jgi:predicted  nucleic acid-binding Zn-ribbon protein
VQIATDRGYVTAPIEQLLRVQACDVRIIRLQKELDDIPLRKKERESSIQGHHDAVARDRETIKSRQAAIKQLEIEIETHKAHIQKLREQQLQLKTNKEFKTMESEIAAIQTAISGLEDRALVIMEEIDETQKDLRLHNTELEKEQGIMQSDMRLIENRQAELLAELQQLKNQRSSLMGGIAPDWMQHYERLFQNKKDAALVGVENGACSGCHMRLPPYLIHDARRQEGIVVCGYCGRMLYTPG